MNPEEAMRIIAEESNVKMVALPSGLATDDGEPISACYRTGQSGIFFRVGESEYPPSPLAAKVALALLRTTREQDRANIPRAPANCQ